MVRQALPLINGVREQVIELPNFLALHNQGSLVFSSKNMNNFPKSLPAFVNYLLEAILALFCLGRMPLVSDSAWQHLPHSWQQTLFQSSISL